MSRNDALSMNPFSNARVQTTEAERELIQSALDRRLVQECPVAYAGGFLPNSYEEFGVVD